MSSRFNPVALLTRRRSKSKTKSQNESVSPNPVVQQSTETAVASPSNNNQPLEPRVTTKLARQSVPGELSPSPRVRFRVFTSLRRARSPRRRQEKERDESTRAISVPPVITGSVEGISKSTTDVPIPPSIKKLNEEIEAQSAAPLAQHDNFELTDVSDVEPEDPISKKQRLTRLEQTSEHTTFPAIEEYEHSASIEAGEAEASLKQFTRTCTQSLDEESEGGMFSVDNEDTEDEDTWQTQRANPNASVDEDSSVTKLSVEYETDYPICENSDSTLSAPQSPLREEWTKLPEEEDRSTEGEEMEPLSSTSASLSDKSLRSGDYIASHEADSSEQVAEFHEESSGVAELALDKDTSRCEVQVNVIPDVSDTEQEQQTTVSEDHYTNQHVSYPDEAGYEEAQEDIYVEPEFEVEPDPEQDPFYAAELAAVEPDTQVGSVLTTPSIIVTSASTGSLHLISESEPQPTPPRPPPPPASPAPPVPPPPVVAPAEEGLPKRPPPPPAAGPPPRPAAKPPGSPGADQMTGQQQKKKKLFGVVDLGPLPSDPDPNFPFRKHLDKSVVPNPKKAIKRIIRGETKAERRQRKEQEELDRLLKTGPNDQQPKATETSRSKEWEEFQRITAQIEHTVQESVTKVQVLTPVEQLQGVTDKVSDQGDGNWAQFETVFGEKAKGLEDLDEDDEDDKQAVTAKETLVIQSENPWEQTEQPSLFEVSSETQFQSADENWVTPDQPTEEDLFALQPPVQEEATVTDTVLPTTELEIELEFESLRGTSGKKLTDDIDSFLGIEDPKAVDTVSEPLVSDPLELLERLKLKSEKEENPLEELGMTLPQTETKNNLFDSNLNQLNNDEDQLTKMDAVPEITDQLNLHNGADEAVDEVSENEDANVAEANELGVPLNMTEDTSDMEEQVDDVLWGGFSEVHVSAAEPQNPFSGDDFSVLPTATVERKTSLGSKGQSTDEQLKSMARPRNKPVRQETLSGNNPFRKRDDADEAGQEDAIDELTRAAAGIELVSMRKKKKSIPHRTRDSFESSDSSIEEDTGLTLKPVPDDTYTTPLESAGGDGDGELMETVDSGFDPLQTIYPESENESVVFDEHSGTAAGDGEGVAMAKEPTILITINELPKESKNSTPETTSVVIPCIQPPQVTPVKSKPSPPMETSEIEPSTDKTDKEIEAEGKHEPPTGWVDFNDEALASEAIDKPILSADEAFDVDWAATTERTAPEEPEPPRPDTPDPELDIPFYPPAEEDAFFRLWLRFPEKKTRVKQMSKYTTDRYWREVAVHFVMENERKVINLHEVDENTHEIAPEPYRSIRIEPYMQLSREKLQQYDKYGKLHVFKLNHVSYRELVGIRPEKFSIKTLQHLVTHKPKQNVAVDHLPVYTEILKFGSLDQNRIRQLMPVFEDALMKIPAHKDTTLNYSREEVCCYVVDEYQGKVANTGTIVEQKARTRILCTAFVNGGPHIVLGLNDKWRYGREVVRRSDILPVMHDEWISIRNPEFHSCVEMDAYEKDHMLKFYPLDGCRFELLRFRVSLRGNRELPMQVKCIYSIDGRRVLMRCELLVPGFFSACNRKGAVPCENVEIHIPVPDDWIYHFRVEKHHKYGSVHSTLRKPGRIKGLERITQMAHSLLPPSILEASIGLAKYEHLYKAVVWRIPRIPDKSEASFRPHLLSCKLNLAPHDTVPEWDTLIPDCQVEYTMPSSTVSGATVRSISVEHTGVAEKFVKYTSKYKYTVDIDYQLGARKEPILKGILDEPPPQDEEEEKEPGVAEPSEEAPSKQQPGDVGDLLGLGMDFGTADSEPVPSQEPTQSSENPLDFF